MKTSAREYIESIYGTRTFARAIDCKDAESIMDLMDDYADYKAEQVAKAVLERAAENAETKTECSDETCEGCSGFCERFSSVVDRSSILQTEYKDLIK